MNLNDIFQAAQGGNAMDGIAKQFGLSQQQAQSAMDSLLPAFSIGMQRQAATAEGMTSLVKMFGQGQFQEAFEHGTGIAQKNVEAGNEVLGQVFGNKEVSRAVASQAALFSGVSDSILKQMLPVIASMIMGGLFKGASNNGLGSVMGQAMQGGLGGMFSQGAQQAQNPMGGLFGNMLGPILGGLFGQKPAQPAQDPMSAGLEMLKTMFNHGTQVQQQYQAGLENIFSQMTGTKK